MRVNRRARKWEPICYWCKMDLTEDTPWRTPMFGREGEYAQGLLAGIIVCAPDCPERPEGTQVFKRRPTIEQLSHMSRAEQELAIAGTL